MIIIIITIWWELTRRQHRHDGSQVPALIFLILILRQIHVFYDKNIKALQIESTRTEPFTRKESQQSRPTLNLPIKGKETPTHKSLIIQIEAKKYSGQFPLFSKRNHSLHFQLYQMTEV